VHPLLANRLLLAYLAATFLSFGFAAFWGGLLGGVLGARLGLEGYPPEAIAEFAMKWAEAHEKDLFSLGMLTALGGLALFVYLRYHRRLGPGLGWKPVPPGEIAEVTGWVLLYGLGFTAFVGGVVPAPYLKEVASMFQADSPWGGFALLLAGGLLAPWLEEWLFRGAMLKSYARRKGLHLALWAQAAVFGVMHGEPVTGVGAFALGWMFGRWVAAGASLKSVFWAHAINNLMSFMGIYFNIPFLRLDTPTRTPVALLGLLVMAFVLARVARLPFPDAPPEEPGPVVSGSLVLAVGIGVFSILSSLPELLGG